jgi:putative transposase
MFRHTTFRFCLDPTVEQQQALARHAGAARFAFNQCLQTVRAGLTHRKTDASIDVPWTAFDLINVFNTWKQSEDAGRVFAIDATGEAEVVATGLPWRAEVCQQVFEEAAVDCGRALAAGMKRQRQLAKSLSRKQKGSRRRRKAAAKLARHHHHVANVRRHFLHQVSNELVKTHDRLVSKT